MIFSIVERGSALPSDYNYINLGADGAAYNLFADFGLFNALERACILFKVGIRNRIQKELDSNSRIRSLPLQINIKHINYLYLKYPSMG